MKLGALDFSPVPAGSDATTILQNTIRLASELERLGYSRLWLGEHHVPNIAHACPEILAALIAGRTERISVGAAGVLMNYRNPLRTAGAFKLLATLYPGRIDLGIARGKVDETRRALLKADLLLSGYADKVADLLNFLRESGPVPVSPGGGHAPALWMLGSATESAELAARHGTAFCMASFLAPDDEVAARTCETYRENFQPSPGLASPLCAVAIAGVCAETEHAAAEAFDSESLALRSTVSGTPTLFANRFDEIERHFHPDEIIILDLSSTRESRERTFTLLAETVAARR